MAESDSLTHLDKLISSLEPIGDKSRGEPLKSEDWNAMVEAVRELAWLTRSREQGTQDALSAGYAKATHKHSGAVGLDWLDPTTRAMVEGRGKDYELVGELKRVDRSVRDLRDQVGELSEEFSSLRSLVYRLRDEILGNGKSLDKFKLRLDGYEELQVGFGRLGSKFTELDGRLAEVVEFRDALSEVGGVVKLGEIRERVGALETLRDKLEGVGGELPDLRSIQQDLAKVEDRLNNLGADTGTGGTLEGIDKATLEAMLDNQLAGRIEEEVGAHLGDKFDSLGGRVATLEEDVGAVVTRVEGAETKLGAHDSKLEGVEGKVGGLEGQLGSFVDSATLATELDKLRVADAGVSPGDDALAGLGSRVDGLAGKLEGIEGELGKLGGELETIGDRYVALDSFEGLSSKVTSLADGAKAAGTRLAGLESSLASAEAGLDDVGTRLEGVEAQGDTLTSWRGSVDSKLANLAAPAGEGEVVADAGLLTRIAGMESKITGLESWKTATGTRLDGLEEVDASAAEAREGLASSLTTLDGKLGGLESELGDARDSLSSLETWKSGAATTLGRVDGLSSTLTELDEQVGGLASELGTTQQNLSKLSTSTASSFKALTTWRSGVDGKLADFGDDQAALTSWREGVDGKLGSLAETAATVSKLDGSVRSLQTATKSLSTWKTGAQAELDELGTELAKTGDYATRLSSLESSMSKVGTWRGTVDSQLTNLASKTASLTKTTATLSTETAKLSALDGRMTTLENARVTSPTRTTRLIRPIPR